MHELGITENIINIVSDKAIAAHASKVVKINLVVGELSGFVPDCIEFYFSSVRKGTIADEADLNFELAPVQLRCRHCSAVFCPQDTLWTCPKCQSHSLEIAGGQELYVESIEVE